MNVLIQILLANEPHDIYVLLDQPLHISFISVQNGQHGTCIVWIFLPRLVSYFWLKSGQKNSAHLD